MGIISIFKQVSDNLGPEIASTFLIQLVTILIFAVSTIGNIIVFFTNKKISKANNEIQKSLGQMQNEDNRKDRMSTYISDKRIEWIQTFRGYISEYIDKTSDFISSSPVDFRNHIANLASITNKIRLHLNYYGVADSYVLSNIYVINRLIELVIILKPDSLGEVNIININEDDHRDLLRIDLYYKIMLQSLCSSDYTLNDIESISASDRKMILNDNVLARGDYYGILISHIWRFKDAISLRKELVIIYSEIYFKVEWERVKFEVENGDDIKFPMNEKYENLLSGRKKELNWIFNEIRQLPKE